MLPLVEQVAVVSVTHVGSLARKARAQDFFRLHGQDLLLVGNPDGTLVHPLVVVGSDWCEHPCHDATSSPPR